jgi:hypothetical protein
MKGCKLNYLTKPTLQLIHSGVEVEVGDDVPLAYTDHDNGNPMRRARGAGALHRELRQGLLRGNGGGGCPDGLQGGWGGDEP